jgi:hypothetical protein
MALTGVAIDETHIHGTPVYTPPVCTYKKLCLLAQWVRKGWKTNPGLVLVYFHLKRCGHHMHAPVAFLARRYVFGSFPVDVACALAGGSTQVHVYIDMHIYTRYLHIYERLCIYIHGTLE